MGRETGEDGCGHLRCRIRNRAGIVVDRFQFRLIALEQTVPDLIETRPEWCNPTRTGKADTHGELLRIIMEAFVPPKPKEFESATLSASVGVGCRTTLRSKPSSPPVK